MDNHESSGSIASLADQRVTFVELFFDLVFIYSVTQVVQLLHHGFDWLAVGQAALVFWLVWWAWSQFSWTLNAADTTHPTIELGVLLATAVAFFLAVAVPEAFAGRALWFAVTYVLVRAIGLTLNYLVSLEHPTVRSALRGWILLSTGGLLAVLAGGYVGGTAQDWLWGLAIVLDVLAAARSGRTADWDIQPGHFAERHGLFVIITLGESLIVAASGVTGAEWTGQLLAVGILVVAVTAGLWWTYFDRALPTLEHAFVASQGAARTTIARDAFTLIHFLMMAGVIAYAAAVEEAIARPAAALPPAATWALAVGIILFMAGTAAAIWRATGVWRLLRVVVGVLTGIAIVAATGASPAFTLGIALPGVAAVGLWEQRRSP